MGEAPRSSGSTNCERGMQERYSVATRVDSGGSAAWSMGGEAPLIGICEQAKGVDGEGSIGCVIEPLSKSLISIMDLAEVEVEAVSFSTSEGTPSNSSSKGDGTVFSIELSSHDSCSCFTSCNMLKLCIVTLTMLGDDMWAATLDPNMKKFL